MLTSRRGRCLVVLTLAMALGSGLACWAQLEKGDWGVEAGRFAIGGKDTVRLKIWAPLPEGTSVRVEVGANQITFVWTSTAASQGVLDTGYLEIAGTEVVVHYPDRECRISVKDLPREGYGQFCVRRPPMLEVCCDLSFSAERGAANPSPQSFRITNTGTDALTWTARTDAPWVQELKPASGSLAGGATVSVIVYVNISGLSEGNYRASIRIDSAEAANSPQAVSAALEVKPSYPDLVISSFGARQPTRCSWDAELWADVKNIGRASASAVQVSFYVDGTRYNASPVDVAPGRTARVTVAWRMPGTGTFNLRAVADPDGIILETNENNNAAEKTVSVTIESECTKTERRCKRTEPRCVSWRCARYEPQCVRWCTQPQCSGCLEYKDVCVEWECAAYETVCVEWEDVCVEYRDCPALHNPTPLTGKAARTPWSGWWWPLGRTSGPTLYALGGPLDKYDRYVLASRGFDPGARRWEETAQGSAVMLCTLELEREGMGATVRVGRYGRTVDEEAERAVALLTEVFTKAIPPERIEAVTRLLEDRLYQAGLWWDSFSPGIHSLADLLEHEWNVVNVYWSEPTPIVGGVGLCHAWAAASAIEPEPTQPRTLYGIEFTVADLKGLLTKAWQQADFVCWSPTPKNFHLLLQEIIGNKGLPVIMDLAPGSSVLNLPAYAYQIRAVAAEGPEITFEAEVWFADFVGDPGFVGTASIRRRFQYKLQFDDKWNILGDGTWLSTERPDALWVPTAPRPGNPRLSLEIIREINADMVVTLSWDREADLNLRVITPQGEISKSLPVVGDGRLDRDARGGPGSTESVFWPQGTGVGGEYTVIIEGDPKLTGTVPFKLRIVAGQNALECQGVLDESEPRAEVTFVLPENLQGSPLLLVASGKIGCVPQKGGSRGESSTAGGGSRDGEVGSPLASSWGAGVPPLPDCRGILYELLR